MKQLIQPNQTNPGRATNTQVKATALVLLSSIMPFLNNILNSLFKTESILLIDAPGVKKLDLDSAIFFLSVPFSYLFIAIGARLGAHKNSYFAVFISVYIQLFLTVNFIFIEKKKSYIITQILLFVICAVATFLFYIISKYYKDVETKNEYLNKTLDRYSEIIKNRK